MAAIAEMGEVEDMVSKDEGNIITNGDVSNDEAAEESRDGEENHKISNPSEPMDTDENDIDTKDDKEAVDGIENRAEDSTNHSDEQDRPSEHSEEPSDNADSNENSVNNDEPEENVDESSQETKASEDRTDNESRTVDEDDNSKSMNDETSQQSTDCSEKSSSKKLEDDSGKEKIVEIHEIESDDEDEEEEDNDNDDNSKSNKISNSDPIELNDSGGEEDDEGDVMIVDAENPKENGTDDVIDLATPEKKGKTDAKVIITPRRSSRNLNKSRSYVECDKDESDANDKRRKLGAVSLAVAAAAARMQAVSVEEESDVEEVLPQDPLACNDSITVERIPHVEKPKQPSSKTAAIVVNDTKKLVEIASKSSNSAQGKKEPTLVIIDTNSILSGRGAVPVNSKSNSISSTNYQTVLPMALPAQGIYPPNMRATITPIPVNSTTLASAAPQPKLSPATITPTMTTPLLPTLTDDMFVVEAPSFIVPYVYEKPPMKDFKDFVKDIQNQTKDKGKKKSDNKVEIDDDDDEDDVESVDDKIKIDDKSDPNYIPDSKKDADSTKPYSYFDSPLGKFFINIGLNFVQEFVQTDLLKQQKRKHNREGGSNPETEKTIKSLVKNLEYSKENNGHFKTVLKKCEFCNFKTESSLAMSYHLETPHMKNFVYKCNFCPYEVRSPHDILFHMEAEHAVKGHLERAPAFHQCPNCPFEDNQKGKLSRHLVTCMRKFKPERNLEPPIDWEPPAKIPRVPKMRQQGLNATAAAYQAMSKTTQYQFLSKMQLQSTQNALNRGRGRPSLGATNLNLKPQGTLVRPPGLLYKQQAVAGGGSVLVSTNYQLSGSQVFQVVGGQEISGRLGNPGHVFLPNMSSASSTSMALQNQSNSSSKKQSQQPSISITPLPRGTTATVTPVSTSGAKPGDTSSKNSFVICEICDGYIKDLEQLRNHMQWIHKIKIHPKMIYNRPPLNCQKCQFRFFTDQGLERHLLGSHGLVTSSMQDAANKSKDSGRCPVCGRVYQWKLLNHVARDHNMTLKPAHLSYKCTVCTATFGMYKQFENHVYSAHSVVAKRVMDKKGGGASSSGASSTKSSAVDQLKPLKINDEITIIPQPAKASSTNGKEEKSTPGTSKNSEATTRAERLARRTAAEQD
ncbi:unnamed protein product [Phyllotreta striolata]|uniref:MOG interacting and ectopic P-granules protein 1 n=1 Tax=Phyllotreta striolata TaxID=444603 RepID=A0A9N9XKL2_PHYSR|nr:unnamed protein product [Phyllotreta striolata]